MEKKEINVNNNILNLWNPKAIVNWSIVFTTAFGSWLQYINWKKLNNKNEAKKSLYWFLGSIFLLLITLFLPNYSFLNVFYLIAWYLFHGRKQIKFIEKNNIVYSKQSWKKPILISIILTLLYTGLFIIINKPYKKDLENTACNLVTKIIHQQFNINVSCKAVKIDKKISNNFYIGKAYLDNGNTIRITIEKKGDIIYVRIPTNQ